MVERKKMVSPAELAAYYGVSHRTIYNWLERGLKSYKRANGRREIDPDEAKEWYENAETTKI